MKRHAFLILPALLLCFAQPVPALADTPMQRARADAEAALNRLENRATTDKGGHRLAAMKHLKAAIAEIDAGIEYDKANVTKAEANKKAERKAEKKKN